MAQTRPLARVAPLARLLSLLLLATVVFGVSPWGLAPLLATLLALLALEGLPLRDFLLGLRGLLVLSLFVLAAEALRLDGGPLLDPEGLGTAGIFILRLLSAFCLGRLFYQSTSSSELREASAALGRFLPGRLGEDFALALVLVLGFVPGILGEWKLSLDAGKARGLHRGSGFRLRLRVGEAFLRRLVLGALELPTVLIARGWTGQFRNRGRGWGPASFLSVFGSLALAMATLLGLT